MKYSEDIKPISYLKAHASDVLKAFESGDEHTLIVTHNGEAKAVFIDIKAYEEMQASLSMLKILAQSSDSLKKGKYKSAKDTFRSIKQKIKENK